jgi:fluoroquinolone resistance protein
MSEVFIFLKEGGMDFSSDTQKEYSEQTFKRLNYSGRQLSNRHFDNCVFSACTFTETAFNRCRFRTCTFKDCDLRLATVRGSAFINSPFESSKITGVNWTTTSWPKGGLFNPVQFADCDISYSVFTGLDLSHIQIVRCVAKGADFAEADLTEADCSYTDFTESRFLHTNLTEADFSHATNYTIMVGLNTLKKTKFSLPEAVRLLDGLDIILV